MYRSLHSVPKCDGTLANDKYMKLVPLIGSFQSTSKSASQRSIAQQSKMIIRSFFLLEAALLFVFSLLVSVSGFQPPALERRNLVLAPCSMSWSKQSTSMTLLFAKAIKKKKNTRSSVASAGIKGFGSVLSSPGNGISVETDRSKEARAFYDYLEQQGAGENLKRCALGYFLLPGGSLRGVVAMKDMNKGDVIIRIPYELAVNLGPEGEDPTGPGLELLKDYCQVLGNEGVVAENLKRNTYYKMLPTFKGQDCLGSTDFFSDEALEALKFPSIKEETLKRRERIKRCFERVVDENFPSWIDGSPVTEEHLQWAVWLVTSRVLTVRGDASAGLSYRLLIPFLDMCNHDRKSPHVLTGRAVPGGELKVVAGAAVKAGEQINICYGGGVAGNDRFLQDYGFLDSDAEGFNIVAQQLLGKRRILEGASAGKTMLEADREEHIRQLRSTTLAEDLSRFQSTCAADVKAAIEYRLGVKKALSKNIVMQ